MTLILVMLQRQDKTRPRFRLDVRRNNTMIPVSVIPDLPFAFPFLGTSVVPCCGNHMEPTGTE